MSGATLPTPENTSASGTNRDVLWSVTPAHTSSPYIRDLVGALERHGCAVSFLTLKELLTSSHRIVHIQWPEHVSRGATPTSTVLKNARSAVILAALRMRGHVVVLTAHNRAPHGRSNRIDRLFRRALQRMAAATIVLVPSHADLLRSEDAIPPGSRVVTIAHPTHPPASPLRLDPAERRRTLVMLGQIHPYHQIDEFIEALDQASNTRPVLIVGGVGDDDLLERLEARAADRPWLTVKPGFASDDELGSILERAAAIVSLQRNTFNSGGPFYALPRHLPIIINRGGQSDDLQEQVGHEWVYAVPTRVHELDVAELEDWLGQDRDTPDLSMFDVDLIARQHIELYELLRSSTPPLQF